MQEFFISLLSLPAGSLCNQKAIIMTDCKKAFGSLPLGMCYANTNGVNKKLFINFWSIVDSSAVLSQLSVNFLYFN